MLTWVYLDWCANKPAFEERLKALFHTDSSFYTKWGWGDLIKEIIYSIIDIRISSPTDQCDLDNMTYLRDGHTLFFFWMDDQRHCGDATNLMYTYINTTGLQLHEIIDQAPMTNIEAIEYIAEHIILENLDYVIHTNSDED